MPLPEEIENLGRYLKELNQDLPGSINKNTDHFQVESLTDYKVRNQNKKRHPAYYASALHAEEMGVHVFGDKPFRILDEHRPNEHPAAREYRINSWEPITKSKVGKAFTILHKVFNERLWSIKFKEETNEAVNEDDQLESYLYHKFDIYGSVLIFAREVLLKQMIADPNALIVGSPIIPESETEFPDLDWTIYDSKDILEYKIDRYYIVRGKEKITDSKGRELDVIKIIYPDRIEIWLNTKGGKEFQIDDDLTITYETGGIIPAWFLGGNVHAREPIHYRSFFEDALPYWNKAIRKSSDLDGVEATHAFPRYWEITDPCSNPDCQGGYVYDEKTKTQDYCPQCYNRFVEFTNTLEVKQVSKDKLDTDNPVIPPMGYIAPDGEIIKYLDDRVKNNIEEGLAAINMEIVNTVGANQSGVAKEMDRSELHSFLEKIADRIFGVHLKRIIKFTIILRYGMVVSNYKDLMPDINVPQHFDLLTIKDLTEDLSNSKKAGISPTITNQIERDIAGKKFGSDTDQKKEILATINLDPLHGYSVDDKLAMTGTVPTLHLKISNNIHFLVRTAIQQDKEFLEKEEADQFNKIRELANTLLRDVGPTETFNQDGEPFEPGGPSETS